MQLSIVKKGLGDDRRPQSWHVLVRKKNPKELEDGDSDLLESMINEGKIHLVNKKDEDIVWIDLALEESAYIITEDTFRDKMNRKENDLSFLTAPGTKSTSEP